MARLNKYEQARQDGMDYAYRIAKDSGLDALAGRVNRNRTEFTPVFFTESQKAEFVEGIKNHVVATFMAVNMIILQDKFGFDQNDINKFSQEFQSYAESIALGYVGYNDIASAMHDELGVDYADDVLQILHNMDEALAEERR